MNTPNPILIMLINMTIVFAVLYVLGLFIRLIHIIDPTKPKKVEEKIIKNEAPEKVVNPQDEMVDKTLAAIIVTALMAYGCKNFELKSIRKM